jgi:hypothetical protein
MPSPSTTGEASVTVTGASATNVHQVRLAVPQKIARDSLSHLAVSSCLDWEGPDAIFDQAGSEPLFETACRPPCSFVEAVLLEH